MTFHEAQKRLEEWSKRGYAFFSDVETKSTHLSPILCPECGAGIRVQVVSLQCAAGCGWQRWWRER